MLAEPRSEFIGRIAELAELGRLLDSARLVTLTGVGGVGKTRLALRAANAHARGSGATTVAFAGLDDVQDPGRVAVAVARALPLGKHSGRDPLAFLVDALSPGPSLLVLDNCEHVLDAVASLVDELLDAAPRLTVLATSRRRLDVDGERVFPVPPLSVDGDGAGDADGASEALALLRSRARAADASFDLTARDRPLAEELCRALDGLPLAIELAATRLAALPLPELTGRLASRFTLLRTTSRSAVSRQRTLGAVVGWSHDLCDARARALWEAVSVFQGPFGVSAAAAVAALDEDETLELLGELVAQSIVSPDRDSGRFRMLETIRAYGRERALAQGTWPALQRRHLEHYRAWAADAQERWYGPDQAEIIRTGQAERAEVHAALATAVACDADTALDLFAALRYHWGVGGFLPEGRAWATRVLSLPGGDGLPQTRSRITAAWLCLLQGDLDEAADHLRRATELAGDAPPAEAARFAIELHRWRGTHALFSGMPGAAAQEFEDSIRLADASGRPADAMLAQFQLTTARSHLGAPGAADSAAAAVRHAEAIGERWMRALALWSLALAAFGVRELDLAERHALASLQADSGIDDPVGDCLALEVLAWIDAERLPTERSAVLLGAARGRWRRIGSDISVHGPHMAAHHDRAVALVRARLGDAAFERAAAAGERLSPAEAVAFAGDAAGTGGLSPRELQVAAGVHEGLSNREIAGRLVLSVRTVDTHVQRILAKLDVGSRAQVAAWYETAIR